MAQSHGAIKKSGVLNGKNLKRTCDPVKRLYMCVTFYNLKSCFTFVSEIVVKYCKSREQCTHQCTHQEILSICS